MMEEWEKWEKWKTCFTVKGSEKDIVKLVRDFEDKGRFLPSWFSGSLSVLSELIDVDSLICDPLVLDDDAPEFQFPSGTKEFTCYGSPEVMSEIFQWIKSVTPNLEVFFRAEHVWKKSPKSFSCDDGEYFTNDVEGTIYKGCRYYYFDSPDSDYDGIFADDPIDAMEIHNDECEFLATIHDDLVLEYVLMDMETAMQQKSIPVQIVNDFDSIHWTKISPHFKTQ